MTNIRLTSIGVARTPYGTAAGIPLDPRQIGRSRIEVASEYRAGLADLSGFDRIWLLFHLHAAGPYQARVVPFLDSTSRGVFATRAPSRPSSLGLSTVALTSVDEETGILDVTGADLIDGTEVLDIKPYVPRFDAYPTSKAGWLDHAKRFSAEAPSLSATSDDRFTR